MAELPIADVTDFQQGDGDARRRFIETVGSSLQTTGFVAVAGHDIGVSLLAEAYRCLREFFDLPVEIRQKYERRELHGQRGYSGFGREHAKDSPLPDLKEFYQIGRELPDDSARQSPFGGNVWPEEVSAFRETFTELYARLESLGRLLLKACGVHLGLQAELLPEMTQHGESILRLIHYPPLPENTPPGSMRAAPHEDINLITLLCSSTAAGLELLDRDGRWTPINVPPDHVIVDAGDMLQNLTNGLLKSTTHRVVNPADDRTRRFSLPFFLHPRPEVSLAPLPECIAATGGEPLFPPLTAGEFLAQRLHEIGLTY